MLMPRFSNPFTDATRLLVGAAVVTAASVLICAITQRLAAPLRKQRLEQSSSIELRLTTRNNSRTPKWHGNGPNARSSLPSVWNTSGSTVTKLAKSTMEELLELDTKFMKINIGDGTTLLSRQRRQLLPAIPDKDRCSRMNPCSTTKFNMRQGCDTKKNPQNTSQYLEICRCHAGYQYDIRTKSCQIVQLFCGQMDANCIHNGECENLPNDLHDLLGRSYNCKCKPAWQGLRCEKARNPCRIPENKQSCGRFDCRRNPADEINGYRCVCPAGYTQTKQTGRPTCRDIDECATTKPCRNGGDCQNTDGAYKCECKWGFRGIHCEIQPPEPYWLSWAHWSPCSVTCSSGLQYRNRECSQTGSCAGMRKDVKNCMGRHLECYGQRNHSDLNKRAGGAGWRSEEDDIVDDAWHFREFQLLKMGLDGRVSFEDELMVGVEAYLYDILPAMWLIGVGESLIILVLLRRNRLRRAR